MSLALRSCINVIRRNANHLKIGLCIIGLVAILPNAYHTTGNVQLLAQENTSQQIVIDVTNFDELQQFETISLCESHILTINMQSQLLACVKDSQKIEIWDIGDDELIHTFSVHGSPISVLTFDKAGENLASMSRSRLNVWRLDNFQRIMSISGDYFTDIDFSSNNRMLAYSTWFNSVNVFDFEKGEEILNIETSTPVLDVVFHPSQPLLAFGTFGDSDSWGEPTVEVWDILSRSRLANLNNHELSINSVNFNVEGESLAIGSSDGKVSVWSWENNNIREFNVSPHSITTVQYGPDTASILAVDEDKILRLLGVDNGQMIDFPQNVDFVTFNSEGFLLFISSNNVIEVWGIPHTSTNP